MLVITANRNATAPETQWSRADVFTDGVSSVLFPDFEERRMSTFLEHMDGVFLLLAAKETHPAERVRRLSVVSAFGFAGRHRRQPHLCGDGTGNQSSQQASLEFCESPLSPQENASGIIVGDRTTFHQFRHIFTWFFVRSLT